jgi:hypothetical protein
MHPADRAEAEMSDGDDIASACECESTSGMRPSSHDFGSVNVFDLHCPIPGPQAVRSVELVSLQALFFNS